jgi:hypothetical protein
MIINIGVFTPLSSYPLYEKRKYTRGLSSTQKVTASEAFGDRIE